MTAWHEMTIANIAAPGGIAGGPFGSELGRADYVPFGVPVIRGGNLGTAEQRFNTREFVYVSEQKADTLARNTAAPGDVIVTQRGTLGQAGIVPDIGFNRFVISQSQMRLRCDPRKADPLFVYYWLLQPEIVRYIEANAVAAGVPHINLGFFKAMRLALPPLEGQQSIAHILGTLDDKIDLNRRTNETLEAMARALFKSWFVDFDPVRAKAAGRKPSGMDAETAKLFPSELDESEVGKIPKGWSVLPLDEIAEFKNGLALQRFRPAHGGARLPVVKIAQLRTGEPDSGEWARADIDPACILEDGDVVFSWSGSLTVVVWCGGRAALNQHLFRVTSKRYPKWFYHQWLLHHLPEFQGIASDKATTMGHIQRHHLSAGKCVVPPHSLLERFSARFANLLEQQVLGNLQCRTLRRVRDALLPRLLSGEIQVPKSLSALDAATDPSPEIRP